MATTPKVREMGAVSGQVWVFIPNELTSEQRQMMVDVICEHGEKLSGELWGEWDNGPEHPADLEEYMLHEADIPELYGKFLMCFFELSEGPSMPRPPHLALVPPVKRGR